MRIARANPAFQPLRAIGVIVGPGDSAISSAHGSGVKNGFELRFLDPQAFRPRDGEMSQRVSAASIKKNRFQGCRTQDVAVLGLTAPVAFRYCSGRRGNAGDRRYADTMEKRRPGAPRLF